jgi:hypothetical protein
MSLTHIDMSYSPPSSPYELLGPGESALQIRSRTSSLDEDDEAEDMLYKIVENDHSELTCRAEVNFSSCSEKQVKSFWAFSRERSYAESGFYHAIFVRTMKEPASFVFDPSEDLRSRVIIDISNELDRYILSCNSLWRKESSSHFISLSGKIIVNLEQPQHHNCDSCISMIDKPSADQAHSIVDPECVFEISSIEYKMIIKQ